MDERVAKELERKLIIERGEFFIASFPKRLVVATLCDLAHYTEVVSDLARCCRSKLPMVLVGRAFNENR
jgi:hypothetical protein